MANNSAPGIRSQKDRDYWRTVHTHTRGVYEALGDRLIEPNGYPQEVAYEALGIVHAMAHLALAEDGGPAAVMFCPVELEERHERAAREDGTAG